MIINGEVTEWINTYCGPDLNVELIKKVLAKIKEEPRRMKMDVWINKFSKYEIEHYSALPPCGTVGCIAGWTTICADGELESSISMFARNALRLRSSCLFFVASWPQFFLKKYYLSNKADVVCEFLQCIVDHYEKGV